jgi:DNA-binding transcriptional MerR regulator
MSANRSAIAAEPRNPLRLCPKCGADLELRESGGTRYWAHKQALPKKCENPKCPLPGRIFTPNPRRPHARFHNRACGAAARAKKKPLRMVKCGNPECRVKFRQRHCMQKYCSTKCRTRAINLRRREYRLAYDRARRKKKSLTAIRCGNSECRIEFMQQHPLQVYCSPKCGTRTRYLRNRAKRIAESRAHYLENREQILASHKTPEFRAAAAARGRKWRKRNPEKSKAYKKTAKQRVVQRLAQKVDNLVQERLSTAGLQPTNGASAPPKRRGPKGGPRLETLRRLELIVAFLKMGWSLNAMSMFLYKGHQDSAYANVRNLASDHREEIEQRKLVMLASDAETLVRSTGAPAMQPVVQMPRRFSLRGSRKVADL